MPYAFIPPGYRAVLLGQAQDIASMGTFTPLEESAAEGALVLMRLDFIESPSSEDLASLEQACRDTGVEPWPGSEYYVYADIESTSVYIAWQKGIAWLPVIIGLLAALILPPLLTAGIWLILPDEIKSLINNLIGMGIMLLVLFLMMKMMPALSPEKEKTRQVKEKAE